MHLLDEDTLVRTVPFRGRAVLLGGRKQAPKPEEEELKTGPDIYFLGIHAPFCIHPRVKWNVDPIDVAVSHLTMGSQIAPCMEIP